MQITEQSCNWSIDDLSSSSIPWVAVMKNSPPLEYEPQNTFEPYSCMKCGLLGKKLFLILHLSLKLKPYGLRVLFCIIDVTDTLFWSVSPEACLVTIVMSFFWKASQRNIYGRRESGRKAKPEIATGRGVWSRLRLRRVQKCALERHALDRGNAIASDWTHL